MIRQPDFSGVWIKVERAKEHVRNLEALIEGFFKDEPYTVLVYDEPKTGQRILKIKVSAQPPPWWGAILGDAIHNLRSSLDLLVCELVRSEGNPVTDQTAFPVTRSANAFESGYLRKVEGAPKAAVDLIKGAKPYKGGNDAFWRLHRLDIADKHRLLIAVGSAYKNVIIDFGALNRQSFASALGVDPSEIPSMPVALRPADRQFPLKDGAELFRGPPMDVNPQISLEIAFGEGEVVEGEPLIPTLRELVQFVEGFIELFPPLLSNDS